ncbi:MAG: hypothetical protein E7043_02480 [Lentisphaerae bacterium]|nr:hypothetical protein [Lentisphaerota bacterium]
MKKWQDPVFIPPEERAPLLLPDGAFKLLFIGNSITCHGISERYHWYGEYGMAASCRERDYVSLTGKWVETQLFPRPVVICRGNVNKLLALENGSSDPMKTLGNVIPEPDLIILQTGEHEGPEQTAEIIRKNYCEKLLEPLLAIRSRPAIAAVGLWCPVDNGVYPVWAERIDDIYREECAARDIPFGSVRHLAEDPACRGYGDFPEVRWHPDDSGMRGYAETVISLITAGDLLNRKRNCR